MITKHSIIIFVIVHYTGFCHGLCRRSPMFDHNTVTVEPNQLVYEHLDEVFVTCAEDATPYDPWGILGSVICREDGNWSAPFRCFGQCKAPNENHVRSDRDSFKHGEILNWGCDTGFQKNIYLDIFCVDGKWIALPGIFKLFLGDLITWNTRTNDDENNMFYIPTNFTKVETCESVREVALNNFSPTESADSSQTRLMCNTDGNEDLNCKRMNLDLQFQSDVDLDKGMPFACMPLSKKTYTNPGTDTNGVNRQQDTRESVRDITNITLAVAAGSVPALMILMLFILFVCNRKGSAKANTNDCENQNSSQLLVVTVEPKLASKQLAYVVKMKRMREKVKEMAVTFFCVDKEKTCHDGFPTLI